MSNIEADSIKQQIKTAESIEEILEIVDKVLDVKNERIQELEEALLKVKDKNVELFIHYKNSILKTKIKDLIENETINVSGFKCIAVEDLEELLEDK